MKQLIIKRTTVDIVPDIRIYVHSHCILPRALSSFEFEMWERTRTHIRRTTDPIRGQLMKAMEVTHD